MMKNARYTDIAGNKNGITIRRRTFSIGTDPVPIQGIAKGLRQGGEFLP